MYGQLHDASNSRTQHSGSLERRDETTFVQARVGLHFTRFTTFSTIYKMSTDSKFGSVKPLQAMEHLEIAAIRCMCLSHTHFCTQRNTKAILLSIKLYMLKTEMWSLGGVPNNRLKRYIQDLGGLNSQLLSAY